MMAVALSGGVDSLASACILKEQGHRVIGIHFRTNHDIPDDRTDESRFDHLADQLDIPVKIIDCSAEFQSEVIGYFSETYRSGKTPNPCLICNAAIKFGSVLSYAKQFGAEALATGHYARNIRDADGRHHLLKGIDPLKDQSYFLAYLTREKLAHARFPLGNYTKSQVRTLVSERNLTPLVKKESQDICFIRGMTYGEFLAAHHGLIPEPGVIEDVSGKVIGEHRGLHRFTIGQRRGINCPASEPYYVIRLDCERNRLIVGFEKELYSSQCRVGHINWICPPPQKPVRVHARIRYRHQAVPSTVHPSGNNTATVIFDAPQAAVAPGQGAVFYDGDEVLGGGRIE